MDHSKNNHREKKKKQKRGQTAFKEQPMCGMFVSANLHTVPYKHTERKRESKCDC